jgi:hypothetical protein
MALVVQGQTIGFASNKNVLVDLNLLEHGLRKGKEDVEEESNCYSYFGLCYACFRWLTEN